MSTTAELRALVDTVVNNVYNQAIPVRAGQLFWTGSAYGAALVKDGIAEYAHAIVEGEGEEEHGEIIAPVEGEEPVEEGTLPEPEITFEGWLREAVGLNDAVVRSIQIAGIEDFGGLADRLEDDLASLLAIRGVGVRTVKRLAENLSRLNAPEQEEAGVEES